MRKLLLLSMFLLQYAAAQETAHVGSHTAANGTAAQTSSQEKAPSQPPAATVIVVLPGAAASGVKAKENWTRITDSPTPAKAKTPDSASPLNIGVTEPAGPKNPPTAVVPEAPITASSMSGTVGPAPTSERQIKYEVWDTGFCRHLVCHASLTYRNAFGITKQETVSLPWTLTFSAQVEQFVYLSAQNVEGAPSVECTIYLDGVPMKKEMTTSRFGIATVSATVPHPERP